MAALPAALWFAPVQLEARPRHAMAVSLFMILAWMFEALDPGLAGLMGCFLFWALGVAGAGLAFSGFADDAPWFLLGALLIGEVAAQSGLARRIAYSIMRRVGTSFPLLLLGLILADVVLTFFVPSGVPRVVLMAAVALGLLEAFGLDRTSNAGRALLLSLTYSATLFDKTIIAGAATITARNAMERFGHVEVLYSRWLLAYLPIDLVLILAAWRLALWLFPAEKRELPGGTAYLRHEQAKLGAWKPVERKSLGLLLIAVVLWLTDFLHHVPPSQVALGVGLAALLPGIGVLRLEDLKRVNYLLIFFVASATGMGKVLEATKSLSVLTKLLFSWITPVLGHPFLAPFGLYWIGAAYHVLLASGISMLATSMPGLMNYAISHHWNALALGMIWTFSSGATLFTYQNAVLIVGYAYGCFSARDLLRFGLWLTAINSVLLVLVAQFYWPLIGIVLGPGG